MRKLLTFLAVSTLSLFMVPVAFGAADVNQNVTRDLNAFANGSTIAGGAVDLTLDVNLTPQPSATLSMNVFDPSFTTFSFTQEALGKSEYQFADTNSAGVTHTWAGGPFAGVTFDVDWTATGPLVRRIQTQSEVVQDPTFVSSTFKFSSQGSSSPASVSGTAGATCCTFGSGNISQQSQQQIQIIRP